MMGEDDDDQGIGIVGLAADAISQQKTWSAFCGMPDGVEGDKNTVHISLSGVQVDGGKL
jgi:hypothetical protein